MFLENLDAMSDNQGE